MLGGGSRVNVDEAAYGAAEVVEHLRSCAVFGGLPGATLARLAAAVQPATFAAGAPVMTEGDRSWSMS